MSLEHTSERKLGDAFTNFAGKSFSWRYIEEPTLDLILKPHLNHDTTALDVACGNGRGINYLIEKGIPAENLFGTDVDEEMVLKAKERFPEVEFQQTDLINGDLEFKVDVVTAIFVMHYFSPEEYSLALKNIYSALNMNGLLFFIAPHPIRWVKDSLDQYYIRRKFDIETPWKKEIPYFHKTFSDYANILIDAGFEIKRLHECEILPEAEKEDLESYKKYASFPSRFAILAQKK